MMARGMATLCCLLVLASAGAQPPLRAQAPSIDDLPASVSVIPRGQLQPRALPPIDLDTTEVPSTRVAARVLRRLENIRGGLRATRYQHATRVRVSRGEYFWDCSGMVGWILERDARGAFAGLYRSRPVARTFVHAIERAPTEGARRGWRRLAHVEDARPGDVFAWLRPSDWPRGATGHVGIVLSRPEPLPEWPDAYLMRIADATTFPHQDDTRPWPGDGGYGEGTLLFSTAGDGQVKGYGWQGRHSDYLIHTDVVFGRLVR